MSIVFIVLIGMIAVLLLAVVGYALYVLLSYRRIPDRLELQPDMSCGEPLACGRELSILSWNVGFGAYSDDFSFFMNGGKSSRAFSKSAVLDNIGADIDLIRQRDPDIILLEEVDTDSTRAWHVDQREMFRSAFAGHSAVYARNYDSPYLMWPLNQPHGASKSGILTMTRAGIESSIRRQLPIEGGFMKLLDLDRCYSLTRVPVSNGKELCLYTLHLSAYTSDGSIATEQIRMLIDDMKAEYAKGAYIIAGGDFNKDVRGDSSAYTGISGRNYSWAKPFPLELLPSYFTLVDSFDPNHIVDSGRASDTEYRPGETFTVTLDAFIVCDRIQVKNCRVIDAKFRNSDHNPIEMTFSLT